MFNSLIPIPYQQQQQRSAPATLAMRVASGADETINKCFELCDKYGYPKPQSREELSKSLSEMMAKNGEPVVVQIIKAHPDYELIKAVVAEEQKLPASFNDNGGARASHYNCAGCGMKNDAGTGAIMPAVSSQAGVANSSTNANIEKMAIFFLIALLTLGSISLLGIIITKALEK